MQELSSPYYSPKSQFCPVNPAPLRLAVAPPCYLLYFTSVCSGLCLACPLSHLAAWTWMSRSSRVALEEKLHCPDWRLVTCPILRLGRVSPLPNSLLQSSTLWLEVVLHLSDNFLLTYVKKRRSSTVSVTISCRKHAHAQLLIQNYLHKRLLLTSATSQHWIVLYPDWQFYFHEGCCLFFHGSQRFKVCWISRRMIRWNFRIHYHSLPWAW